MKSNSKINNNNIWLFRKIHILINILTKNLLYVIVCAKDFLLDDCYRNFLKLVKTAHLAHRLILAVE